MRNTIVLIVLAILAAATWLATWQRQDVRPQVDRAADTRPLGYYARGARVSGTDEQGRLSYRIFAERLDELPGDERLQLTGVTVEYRPAGETEWTLSAASASYAKDGSEIDLLGNVELKSAPSDGGRPLTIATEKLRFSPDTSSAESDEPVEIRFGDLRLRAGRLRTHLKGDSLRLESDVHGTLVP